MFLLTPLLVGGAALAALAAPASRAPAVTDTDILNYALTLEHLENAFYSGALASFDHAAFAEAGYAHDVHARFTQIAAHEAAHVAFLEGALGDAAVAPCQYNFSYHDVQSFVALSQALEGTGVSAYLGAAASITNKGYLTAAASVLTTEARHSAWVGAVPAGVNPWSGAFDVPLGLDQVYTIAAAFIASCPASNPPLPVAAFPALTFPPTTAPGSLVAPSFSLPSPPSQGEELYIAFYTGLSVVRAPLGRDGCVQVPQDLQGTVYAVVTASANGTVGDDQTLAGPAILMFPF